MKLFPAIDIRDGRAVRLLRGDYAAMTVYSDDPAAVARGFADAGAEFIHIVDLDGARSGGTPNLELIGRIIAESGLKAEVGGGIRDLAAVKKYLELGVMRVIIGTAAVTDPQLLSAAVDEYGDAVAVGVDVRDGVVALKGWTESGGVGCFELCEKLQNEGVKTVICTDISKDGAMQGPNVELYRELKRRFSMELVASGGVTELNDLSQLLEAGADGAILGKSLYTGAIDLREALRMFAEAER